MEALLHRPLILASASPRRAELLKYVGLNFTIIPSHIPETAEEAESPQDHVLRLSREKALPISDGNPDACILGADTIVVIGGEILGKPVDGPAAAQMLNKLSGRVHEVYTGFTVMGKKSQTLVSQVVRSLVTFRRIPDDEIAWYISTAEPYDKAGGYAVQGSGAFFIKEIHGSYTNVMGLPLCEVVDVLRKENILTYSRIYR